MTKLNIIYCGTPEFSVPCLRSLHESEVVNLVAVVTMPDRKSGRGQKLQPPPVALFAKEHDIHLIQTENINKSSELQDLLASERIDAFIVLAFAQFLGNKILNAPRLGCFNIHTSLLPKYRGAAPIQYALWNGDSETGVSIQKMVKEMDAGDIVATRNVKIDANETAGELFTKLQHESARLLVEFLPALASENIIGKPQDIAGISFAPTLQKTDGLMSFEKKSFAEVKNHFRAMTPWPGCYCYLNGMRLKVLEIEESPVKTSPGDTNTEFNCLLVGCSDKSVRLKSVQLEGKKSCSDIELLNGLKNKYKNFAIGYEEQK